VGILFPGKKVQVERMTFPSLSFVQLPGTYGTALPPPWEAGSCCVRFPLKSPIFSAAVGTFRAPSAVPRLSRRHSSEKKKKILFFLIGPPTLPPKLLYLNCP